jgi:hypothetical protein
MSQEQKYLETTIFHNFILSCLTTEISTSKQKRFSLVTFVDTPGLVDGDMKYPFDVNKSILWLGKKIFKISANENTLWTLAAMLDFKSAPKTQIW